MSDELDKDTNQTDQQQPERNQLAELFEQLAAIPWASIWSLSLAIGGLLLLSFFSSIGYLPDLDINALSVTVVAVALVGTFFVLIIGFGLTLPMMYVNTTDDVKTKMYVFAQAIVGIGLAFGVIAYISYDFGKEVWARLALLALFAVLSVLSTEQKTLENWFRNVCTEALWGLWAIVIPMFDYQSLAQKGGSEWKEIFSLLVFTFAFAMISIFVAYAPAKRRAMARFAAAVVAVFLLSIAAHRPALVPQASVAALGLSQQKPVTLILSETGCNSANMVLSGKPCAFDKATKLGRLDNVRIVSRIGGQFVIHWQPKDASKTDENSRSADDDNQVWRRMILKKDDVASWAYDFGKNKVNPTKGNARKS